MAEITYRIRVRKIGSPIHEVIKSIEDSFVPKLFEKDLAGIRNTVLKAGRDHINSNRKRDVEQHTEDWRTTKRNNLINTLEASTPPIVRKDKKVILDIGKKKFLDEHAPYWYKVNYGGKIEMDTPGKALYGYFGFGNSPKTSGGRDVFHYQKNWKNTNIYNKYKSSFVMKPMNPIPPLHYLNKMAEVFDKEIHELINFYKNKVDKIIKKSKPTTSRGISESDIEMLIDKGIDVNAYKESQLIKFANFWRNR